LASIASPPRDLVRSCNHNILFCLKMIPFYVLFFAMIEIRCEMDLSSFTIGVRMLNIVVENPQEKHAAAIADICSIGWRQTVKGKLSDEYQAKNIQFWYNIDRVKSDIKQGSYSHIALLDAKVVGVIG